MPPVNNAATKLQIARVNERTRDAIFAKSRLLKAESNRTLQIVAKVVRNTAVLTFLPYATNLLFDDSLEAHGKILGGGRCNVGQCSARFIS